MIDRVTWNSVKVDGISSFIHLNLPVVITGVDSTFSLMEWDLDRLLKSYGNVVLRILKSPSQYFVYDEIRERTVVQMPLCEFFQKGILEPGNDGFFYTLGRSPIDTFCDFDQYMSLPPSLSRVVEGPLRRPEKNIWISPKGTRTALHFDAVENLNLQIQGSKSFLLYPPRIAGMNVCKWNSQAAYVSKLDPRDQNRVNGFPYNTGIEVLLTAGEMLYLPYGWWHQVDTVGDLNLNANFWWFPRLKLLSYPQQTLRGAAVLLNRLGLHPHVRAEKMASKKEV